MTEPSGSPPPLLDEQRREESLAERYGVLQRAGGIVAPLLTVVLAFFLSGLVVFATTGSVGKTLETYAASTPVAIRTLMFKVL